MKQFIMETPFGKETVRLLKRRYSNGTLAVEILSDSEEGWEPYCIATVNLDPYTGMNRQSETKAYLDTNNCGCIEKFLKENHIATPCGESAVSGFCTYPLYEFDLSRF